MMETEPKKTMTNAERQKDWRLKNPEKWREISTRYKRNRYANDELFKEKQKEYTRVWLKTKMETDDDFKEKMAIRWRNNSAMYYKEHKDIEQIRKKGRYYMNRYCSKMGEDDELTTEKIEMLLRNCQCEITCEYVMDSIDDFVSRYKMRKNKD